MLQAAAHRQLLDWEAAQVAQSLRWAEPVYRGWQQIKPWAWLVAPVAGFFAARNFRSLWRWGGAASQNRPLDCRGEIAGVTTRVGCIWNTDTNTA